MKPINQKEAEIMVSLLASWKPSQITEMIARIDADAMKPPWISVKDRLPEQGRKVLIGGSTLETGVGFYHLDGWYWDIKRMRVRQLNQLTDSVTHWMPLPNPPDVEEEE